MTPWRVTIYRDATYCQRSDSGSSHHGRCAGPLDLRQVVRYAPLNLREESMAKTDLLQGTLDLLILRILALGPNHAWRISDRIGQTAKGRLRPRPGAL